MDTLDSMQLSELSNNFSVCARAIQDYRNANQGKISAKKDQQLEKFQGTLLTTAEDLLAASTNVVMNESLDALEKIRSLSAAMRKTLDRLLHIQKVIDFVSALAKLAESILSSNPAGIARNLQAVLSQVHVI